MSDIPNEGLTIEQASPDLTTTETEVEVTETESTNEVANTTEETKRQTTKSVSDRINKVKAQVATEYEARIKKLEADLHSRDNELRTYRAKENGMSVEELAAKESREAEERRNIVRNDPEFQELQRRDFERQRQEVLIKLQGAFPNDNIESLDAIPSQEFYRMLQVGVDPIRAYRASVVDERVATPPTSNSAKSDGDTHKNKYTPESLTTMSAKELAGDLDKFMEAYRKW